VRRAILLALCVLAAACGSVASKASSGGSTGSSSSGTTSASSSAGGASSSSSGSGTSSASSGSSASSASSSGACGGTFCAGAADCVGSTSPTSCSGTATLTGADAFTPTFVRAGPWASGPSVAPGTNAAIALIAYDASIAPGACGGSGPDLPQPPPSIFINLVSACAKIAPGTYPITANGADPGMPGGPFAGVSLQGIGPQPGEVGATSGTVTLTAVCEDLVGTFTAVLGDGGTLSGSFTAPYCPTGY
jgi:hypothetical protein